MGTINIYNSIGSEYQTINGCGKLVDLLPTIDFEHSIVLKAGNRLNSDYEVKPDDLIFVRKIPGATTTIIAGVIVGVGAILAGGAILGAAFESIYDDKTKEMQKKAQQDAQNLASQINQLPFIKGAQNKSALGQSIPYVMGDVYHTPYKLTDGYYSIEDGDEENGFGTKQYYNVIANFGFGNLQFKEILIGDTSILKNENGIPEGVHDMDETSIFYDSTNKIEICQAGTDFTAPYFGKKVILTSDGSEIKHAYGEAAEPVIRELTEYTKTVEICIQINGLRQYNSEASRWEKRKIKVIPEWTNVENPKESDWNPLNFIGMNNNEIELNTNHTIRFVARKTFTAEEVYGKKIKIRLIKDTPALESNSNESCYLAYYQSFCYDNKQSTNTNLVDCKSIDTWTNNKTVKVGLRLLANDNTKDLLNEIHAYVCGLARTWNGREWTLNKVPTRNPAAWVYEIMTSDAHIPSKYSDDEFDLESLGQLYEYCENPNNVENPTEKDKFYTDGILTSGIKKIDLVSTILNSCSAVMFKNAEGKMEVRIDRKEDTPVALLNAESISDITFSKDFTRMPDGLKVTFTNRESWQIDTFYIKRDGTPRTQDDTFTELNLNYVTTYEHAYKIALKHLKQMVLQPKELTVDVGRDGDYYPLLSTVMLQYHTFRIGLQSSTITGLIKDNDGNISGINVSDYIKMEAGKNYGVIIQAVSNTGRKCFYKQVAFTHEVRKSLIFNDDIVFSEDILPAIGDTISFGELNENGEFTKIRDVMKITGFTPNGTKGYKLTLKNYNPSIYETGAIPEYKSNITEPPKPVKEIPMYEKLEGAPGQNGYSSYTIQLFKRYSGVPNVPASVLTYSFNPPVLSGDLEGWSQTIPEVDDDNNPLYEIHFTLINQNNEVSINSVDWSEPVLVLKDSNISIAEIQEMINKVTPPPTIEADVTFFPIGVNENGINPKDQSVTTEIHVRQMKEELGFNFGNIVLPDGYSYTLNGNKITITCKAGTFVKSGSFIIPVKYRFYKSNAAYVSNADNNEYYIGMGNVLGNFDNLADIPTSPANESIINWVGEDTSISRASDGIFEKDTAYQFISGIWKKFAFIPYGFYIYEEKETISNIGIGYTNTKGFRYLNSITRVSDIPADVVIGDYFTWNGDDTNSNLVEGGKFLQCCVYQYDGDKWKLDESTKHNTDAIFDILKIAESKLSQNNSTAEMFLNRICTNQAFIKTLVVSGSAFIKELQALNIYANQITIAKDEAISKVEEDIGVDGLTNKTIIEEGYLRTDLIKANTIEGNKIKSESITAEQIDVVSLKTKQGFFDQVESNEAHFYDASLLNCIIRSQNERVYFNTSEGESVIANKLRKFLLRVRTRYLRITNGDIRSMFTQGSLNVYIQNLDNNKEVRIQNFYIRISTELDKESIYIGTRNSIVTGDLITEYRLDGVSINMQSLANGNFYIWVFNAEPQIKITNNNVGNYYVDINLLY